MKVHHGSTLIMIDTYFSPLSFFFFLPLTACFADFARYNIYLSLSVS